MLRFEVQQLRVIKIFLLVKEKIAQFLSDYNLRKTKI